MLVWWSCNCEHNPPPYLRWLCRTWNLPDSTMEHAAHLENKLVLVVLLPDNLLHADHKNWNH